MPHTPKFSQTEHQRWLVREEQQQRAEKLKLLKEQLEAAAAKNCRRITEVKTQNMNRLNSIRRFIDEARTKTNPIKERGKRNSEPVSPSPSEPGITNQENSELPSVPQFNVINIEKELCGKGKIKNRFQASSNLTTQAGHLALNVLKHFWSSNKCCPDQLLPDLKDFRSSFNLANKAKVKAEEQVKLLNEQIEELNIELKGLSNELKDTRRTYEERLYSYEKKHKTRIRVLKRQIESNDRRQLTAARESKTVLSENPPDELENRLDESKLVKSRMSDSIFTNFDKVISPGSISDNSKKDPQEVEEDVYEEEESELAGLHDKVRELESEVEELRAQYTKEKSQRLHVMWCLEAKSRQVQNLLSVQEEHSQLLIQHSQLIEENNMLKNKLESLSEDYHHISNNLLSNSQKLESKYALLQTAEIKRLREALQRATEIHPEPEDRNTPSATTNSSPIPLSQRKDHLRAKTVTVSLQKMVERNNSNEIVRAPTSNTPLHPNYADLPGPSPVKSEENPNDETINENDFSRQGREGIQPYFVYTLHESPFPATGPFSPEVQEDWARAAAFKWAGGPKESPDTHPAM